MGAACALTKQYVVNYTKTPSKMRCGGDGAGGISFRVDLIINHGPELTRAFKDAWDAECVCPNY